MSFLFTLYVTGENFHSERAVFRAQHLIEDFLPSSTLKVVDVLKNPEIAEEHNIIATPVLEKTTPSPKERIIGDLHDTEEVLEKLNLHKHIENEG